MTIIVIAIVIMACVIRVEARLILLHPIKVIKYLTIDPIHYIHDRAWKRFDGGHLNCYDAHFGGGKTLSGTHWVRILYDMYNNQRIYDRQRKKWVLQKLILVSNVTIKEVENFVDLASMNQLNDMAMSYKKFDEVNDTRTCIVVLLDEASSELNSREFKSNFNPETLRTLITSRHFHMDFYYTSQKFKLVDALLRSVTQRVVWCDKRWRFMVQHFYDADEMEYATNPTLVKPFRRKGFFIDDKDFESYDTLATVERLDKSTREGKMMTAEEILTLRGDILGDNDSITTPSKRLKKLRKAI